MLERTVDGLIWAQKLASAELRTTDAVMAQITSALLHDDDGKPVVDEQVYQVLQARLAKIPASELGLISDLLSPEIGSYEQVFENWRAAAERETAS